MTSNRLGKEHGAAGEIWQKGFSEVRVDDRASFERHRAYIAMNPVKAGIVDSPGLYPFCFTYLANRKSAGAKAQIPYEEAAPARLKSSPDTKQEPGIADLKSATGLSNKSHAASQVSVVQGTCFVSGHGFSHAEESARRDGL